jgi:hypothetical protein
MRTTELPALAELRESLREAARRDVAARGPRRRRRRGLAVLAVVLLGGTAVAGAADLISSGEPLRDERAVPQRYHPSTALQLSVKAKDQPLDWGVGVYTSRNGDECALAGRLRGVTLGELRGGVFRPYPAGRPGACGRTDTPTGAFADLIRRDGRTLAYGRARPGARSVIITVDGRPHKARTGAGGAFVLVFKGSVTPSSLTTG